MAHIYLSAAHKSSGKTIVSLGLCAALKSRELRVQAFKKGPDYIDPLWLGHASQQPCYNLDFFQMSPSRIQSLFAQHNATADISVIEGNKGLHDGLSVDGSDSNAAMAKLLSAPVVLVLDTQGITRGIAPLVLGYTAFDADVHIAGVILNKVAGPRHEQKLRQALQQYTDVPVLGAVHKHKDLFIEERHLGLVPSNEASSATDKISKAAAIIQDQVDLDKILDIAGTAAKAALPQQPATTRMFDDVRVGVIRDQAFGFYYADDLDILRQHTAEVVYIDALRDTQLPDIDGLFIGGGFPESFARALQDNTGLKQSIKSAIDNGLPVYAECGGLMYLSRCISIGDHSYDMVGVLPVRTRMQSRPIGRGYVELGVEPTHPWLAQGDAGDIKAHEFHYSDAEVLDTLQYAYKVKRGHGIDGKHDGIIYKNVLASYAHLRNSNSNWAEQFLKFIQQQKGMTLSANAAN